ncbi:hypothetical protein [Dolichospermum sp. UHCC 0259]|uniref:hypothetical protein n=1 Tax=Dolichospermum sp. UHCC 0259 TaxID=2590010 RepID=UPI0014480CFD|nr:hypothetical protein [Dolichospermum sp. UHCC 0259]
MYRNTLLDSHKSFKISDDFRSQGVRSQESGVRRKKEEEKSPIFVQILFIVNP